MDFIVVIPARYESSRLPGKPLIDLEGKTLLQRTYDQCALTIPKDKIYVATDDQRIVDHCNILGMSVIMTSNECKTGTDRVAEVANIIDTDYYINVQGDEPLIDPKDINKVIDSIKEYSGDVINGYAQIHSEADYKSRNIPKVVLRPDGRLLYMSRSPIPYNKKGVFNIAWRQICVYAFPKESLKSYASKLKKTVLEQEEDIEILRFLEMGYDVRMINLSDNSVAVDTEEDAEKVRKILSARSKF